MGTSIFLVERGQQIKVFSQLSKKARELGYMVPTIKYGSLPEEQYEGATVLEAQKGAYYTPITALDFEALYPYHDGTQPLLFYIRHG